MKTSIGPKDMVFPNPVFIVGTYGLDGKPNVMNVAWAGICSSNPPCVAISIREGRQTYKNIMETKAFTINIPSEEYVKEADYFGMVSGSEADKFTESGLTPVKSDQVNAPYIQEFPFNLECKLIDSMKIGEHMHLIGQIVDIKVDTDCLNDKGIPVIEKIKPLLFDAASSSYNGVGNVVAQAFSAGNEILKKSKE